MENLDDILNSEKFQNHYDPEEYKEELNKFRLEYPEKWDNLSFRLRRMQEEPARSPYLSTSFFTLLLRYKPVMTEKTFGMYINIYKSIKEGIDLKDK